MTINNSVNAATATQSFGGAVSFTNASVTMSALASGTTANVVYYGAGGILTQGGFTAFSTSSNFTITGTWAFNGGFNVASAAAISIANSAGNISVSSAAGSVSLSSSTGVFLPSLASAATSFVVLYNSGTGQLSQSAYTAFSTSANYTLTGSWNFTGPTFAVSATAAMTIQSVSAISLISSSSNIQLTASSGFINLTSPLITATAITSATTSEVLYWNSSTGSITHGAAPSSGPTIVNVTGTSQALAAGTRYIINSPGNAVALSLPASIAVGGEIEVVWQSATSWTISQQTGQAVRLGSVVSTTSSGTVGSNTAGDSIRLICTVANTSFTAVSAVGNLDVL